MKLFNSLRNSYWGFLLKRRINKIRSKILSANQQMTEDDYNAGWTLYQSINANIVKPKKQVIRELNKLYQYWHCFPDTYFRFGMFLKNFTDWNKMTSFLPQVAAVRYENSGRYREYGIILDDKILFNETLFSLGFPVPDVVFRYINQRFFVKGKEKTEEEMNSLLRNLPCCKIFAKPSTGSCANGIFILCKEENGRYRIINGDGTYLSNSSGGG